MGEHQTEKENPARKSCNCLCSNFAIGSLQKSLQDLVSLRLWDGCEITL